MKTGIIVEAEVTDRGINHVSVHRTFVEGEEWVADEDKASPNLNDINKYSELLVEGMITVIAYAHKAGLKDECVHLREVINRLEASFVQPSEVKLHENTGRAGYISAKNKSNDGHEPKETKE